MKRNLSVPVCSRFSKESKVGAGAKELYHPGADLSGEV